MSGRSRRPSSSCWAFSRCCSASRRAYSASASAPSTFTRPRRRQARRLPALLQLGCGAGEDFDQTRLVFGVAFQALANRLAQMIERGLDEGRKVTPIAAFATLAAAPAVDALAERA